MPVRSRRPTAAQWLAGTRPRTLPAAIAPVLAGTGVAATTNQVVWWKALLALVVALGLQVGVNYANDYSDGVRGTDADRVGPLRLVGSGVADPGVVRAAAVASFGVAVVAGGVLAVTTDWKLLVVGALAVAAAWTYTGGPWPYGYHALGEVSVFLFFGLVAVLGTAYVQTRAVTGTGLAVAAAMGGFAGAILVANNLRDVASDGRAGKRTLAVVLGVRRTQVVFGGLLALPFVACLSVAGTHPGALVALGSLPLIVASVRRLAGGATGLALVAVLRDTARAELGYAILLAVGLALR